MVKVLTRPNSVLRRTQAGDILLAIDDVPLAEDGSIPFRDAERIGCLGQWRQLPLDSVIFVYLRASLREQLYQSASSNSPPTE